MSCRGIFVDSAYKFSLNSLAADETTRQNIHGKSHQLFLHHMGALRDNTKQYQLKLRGAMGDVSCRHKYEYISIYREHQNAHNLC